VSSAPLLPSDLCVAPAAPAAPVVVRAGSPVDIGAVEAMMADAFDPAYGEAWTRGQCLGVLAMPGVALWLAEQEGSADGARPAGFALVRVVADEAELLLLAVACAARRRGTGAALLETAARAAAAAGAAIMHLEVREDNPAVHLYAACGFARVGVRRAYYRGADGRARDAHSFRRDLRPAAALHG